MYYRQSQVLQVGLRHYRETSGITGRSYVIQIGLMYHR